MPGQIIYRGPSRIDGQPIVVVVTWKSKNEKTGNMLQTWILNANVEPHTAQASGCDRTICGDCPLRPSLGGGCYVRTGDAPLSVYRAFHRGNYDKVRTIPKLPVRLGAYGDPSAVPFTVWHDLIWACGQGYTGYTHSWNQPWADPMLRTLCMASVETKAQAQAAHAAGWRTFRVVGSTIERPSSCEVVCLAESRGVQCARCRLCSGSGRGKSIVITAHGAAAKRIKPEIEVSGLFD